MIIETTIRLISFHRLPQRQYSQRNNKHDKMKHNTKQLPNSSPHSYSPRSSQIQRDYSADSADLPLSAALSQSTRLATTDTEKILACEPVPGPDGSYQRPTHDKCIARSLHRKGCNRLPALCIMSRIEGGSFRRRLSSLGGPSHKGAVIAGIKGQRHGVEGHVRLRDL